MLSFQNNEVPRGNTNYLLLLAAAQVSSVLAAHRKDSLDAKSSKDRMERLEAAAARTRVRLTPPTCLDDTYPQVGDSVEDLLTKGKLEYEFSNNEVWQYISKFQDYDGDYGRCAIPAFIGFLKTSEQSKLLFATNPWDYLEKSGDLPDATVWSFDKIETVDVKDHVTIQPGTSKGTTGNVKLSTIKCFLLSLTRRDREEKQDLYFENKKTRNTFANIIRKRVEECKKKRKVKQLMKALEKQRKEDVRKQEILKETFETSKITKNDIMSILHSEHNKSLKLKYTFFENSLVCSFDDSSDEVCEAPLAIGLTQDGNILIARDEGPTIGSDSSGSGTIGLNTYPAKSLSVRMPLPVKGERCLEVHIQTEDAKFFYKVSSWEDSILEKLHSKLKDFSNKHSKHGDVGSQTVKFLECVDGYDQAKDI